MGELENRQMLKAIADFEKNVFSPSAKVSGITTESFGKHAILTNYCSK